MKLTKTDTIKNNMINALESTLGIVSRASNLIYPKDKILAESLRKNHYTWIKQDKNYELEVESISNISLDFAEHSLLEQIQSGNTTATIFYLKTKGRGRGYIERIVNENHNHELKIEVQDKKGKKAVEGL